jgi:curli production assembly/transport component CsgG/holdfast attachment protein HfaB
MKAVNKLKTMAASLGAIMAAGGLAGCVTPSASSATGLYAKPIGNAPVTANPTPYSAALVCLGDHARATSAATPRVAVGRIVDYTGKVDVEGGRKITQGASLMAISAFAKSGARLVERFDTSVSELELKYANNKLISADEPTDGDFRRIFAGQVPGSDYYLVGGITELNYNIRSIGADAFFGDTGARDTKGNLGAKLFVMNIGLDLRLVDTKTLEVKDVISYQKQIVGRELRAGVFSFWDDVLIDVGAGERALEPIQLAVRAAVERAVLEMMGNLYGVQSQQVCAEALRAGGDPLGAGSRSITGDFATASGAAAAIASDRRADPNAWHDRKDPALKTAISLASGDKAVEAAPAPKGSMRPVGMAVKPAQQPTKVVDARPVETPAAASAKKAPVRTTSLPKPAALRGAKPASALTASPTDLRGLK